jgi:hypothetical protein
MDAEQNRSEYILKHLTIKNQINMDPFMAYDIAWPTAIDLNRRVMELEMNIQKLLNI